MTHSFHTRRSSDLQRRPPVHERRWHRRGALQDPLEAQQVAVVDVGQVGDALEHGGGGCERGDAVALDDVDDARCVELLEHVELVRSEEHTSELQSLMRISYAVFFLKKKKNT